MDLLIPYLHIIYLYCVHYLVNIHTNGIPTYVVGIYVLDSVSVWCVKFYVRRTEKMRLDIALGCFVFVVKVKAKEEMYHVWWWGYCSLWTRFRFRNWNLGIYRHIVQLHTYLGPTQVKCRLVISDIFYVMNFRHFLEMLEFDLWHFWKMLEINYIKNARN